MIKRLELKIYGRVQMVFFRDSARRKAKKLGLTGFARNQADGSVYIVAEGEREKLEELAGWARRGPYLARVEGVDVEWKEQTGEFDSFDVVY